MKDKEKGKVKKIKHWLKEFYHFVMDKKVLRIILCALPFVIMDLATGVFANDIEFYETFKNR